MPNDIDDILHEYDELSQDVSNSNHSFFSENLTKWFDFLDDSTIVSGITARLEAIVDFPEWKETGLNEQSGTGHGTIKFPRDRDKRLGVQLQLFRSLTSDPADAWRFAHQYVSSERRIDDSIRDLVDQIFDPFARDLRRHLQRASTSHATDTDSDDERIVLLEKNEKWQAALDALDEAKRVLETANDPMDKDVKTQHLAELSAGKELLNARQVRIGALRATVGRALRYLSVTFASVGIGKAASVAWDRIFKTLLGLG